MFGEVQLRQVHRGLGRGLVGHLKETARGGGERGARAVAVETRETEEGADQHRRSQEQVIGGVVQQVEAGGRVHVGVSHQLAGEQRLPGAAAQEAAHLAVGHVHPVGQHLRTRTDNPTSSAPPTPQRSPRGAHLHPQLDQADVGAAYGLAAQMPSGDRGGRVSILVTTNGGTLETDKENSLVLLGEEDVQALELLKQICKTNTAVRARRSGSTTRRRTSPRRPHFSSRSTLAALW